MKKSVTTAVRAGSSFAKMNRPEPIDPPPPPPPPPPALWRRVIRRLARKAKPLALPLLHRLQIRMQSAIDSSAAVAGIDRRTREQSEQLAAALSVIVGQNHLLERIGLSVAVAQRRVEQQSRQLDEKTGLLLRRLDDQADDLSGRLEYIGGELVRLDEKLTTLSQKLDLLLQRNLVPFADAMAIRTDAGYLFAPAEDHALVLYLLEARGRLEPGTSAVLQVLGGSGCTVIDVGANVGMHTLPLARQVGAAGRVLALEAAPRMAQLLARTVQMHDLGWVEVHPVAASDIDGTVRLNLSARTSLSSVLPIDDATETVDIPARRLDSLVGAGERVDLVKIDVEGAELQVWRGMQRVVADNPDIALILEFGPSHLQKAGQDIAGWFEELQSTGLRAWEIDETSGALRPLRQPGLDEVFSINILFLRDLPSKRGLTVL